MQNFRVVVIGGQNENGKNCFFIETQTSIYIFNAGMKIPINSNLGIAFMHADFTYLVENKDKIKGIFVGTSTFVNMGSLCFLLKKIGKKIPIYTHIIGETTINTYFERKFKMDSNDFNIVVCENLQQIDFVELSIIPVKVTNYLPLSLSWIIKTPIGNIVVLEDFIINNDKMLGFNSYISQLNVICKGNVLLLITTPGNIDKNLGYTTPNHKCADFYKNIINNAPGRVIIALNDYNGYSVCEIANIAKKTSKPFIIYSTIFMNVFSSIVKNKQFNAKGLISLPVSQINNSDNAIIVLIEPDDVIYKKCISILNNQSSNFTIKPNDTFVLGTTMVPGYEMESAMLMDQVNRLDLKNVIIPKTILDLKASNEDHKYILELLKPKYIIPINGLYMNLYKYFRLATTYNPIYNDKNIFLIHNGDSVLFNRESAILEQKYLSNLSDSYISTSGNYDSHFSIIKERKQLSISGIIFLTVYFSKQDNSFINKIDIKSFGLSGDDKSPIISEIYDKFKNNLQKFIIFENGTKILNLKETKTSLKKGLLRIFERKITKKPIILPNIIEVL